MIKNIVFDMGNVLMVYDPEAIMTEKGIADPADRALIKNEVFTSHFWSAMDWGALSDEKALEKMEENLPERLHTAAQACVMAWDRPIIPVPGMEKLVRQLKSRGYKLYLLSNASLRQKDYWPRIPGWDAFDGRMVSAEEGMVKPQPEIYALLCQRYGLEPAECVFIDDSPLNCQGAVCSGLAAVVFHGDEKALRQKLCALGVAAQEE